MEENKKAKSENENWKAQSKITNKIHSSQGTGITDQKSAWT